MDNTPPPSNPYEAYFQAMMDMQKEMAQYYVAMQQQNGGNMPPMMPPMMAPFMQPHPFMHPHMPPPNMMPPQPHWEQAQHWGQQPPMPQQPPQQTPPESQQGNDALFEQAQAMLDGALGEEAGMFKEILGTFGMNDKEFWKGAMIGAAAALLLSNENVRGKLMGLVSGAGDVLKSGGENVKETAMNTASSVKENMNTGSEIFRDTVSAGKQGFQESVEKHKVEPAVKIVSGKDVSHDVDLTKESPIQEQ